MTTEPEEIERERAIPERVAPLNYDGIRYEAEELSPADPNINTGTDRVRAYDSASDALLWEKQVYATTDESDAEFDKQWTFITTLALVDGKLVVTNERGETYTLDPKTGAS